MSQRIAFLCKILNIMSVKYPGNTFDLNPKWARTLLLRILQEIFTETIPQYRNSNLTPCCGLEVQKPTQTHKSVEGLGNTFDLSPKWARTLPLGIVYVFYFIETPPPPPPQYQS